MNEAHSANEIVLEDGQLVCSLTGRILKVTDKELALQSMIDMLTFEYGFPVEDIEREFTVKYVNEDDANRRTKIDLAVFNHGMAHDEDNLCRAIVVAKDAKVKADDRSKGAVATLKRLMGNITDTRKANPYTLDTIAQYLGFSSWNNYSDQACNDSLWNYADDTVYILALKAGQTIELQYLNRKLKLIVVTHEGQNALKVVMAKNSSLRQGDILLVHHIRKGEVLEAEQVIRGTNVGNYKTHGVVTAVQIFPHS